MATATSVQPLHEFLIVRPRPDIHEQLAAISLKGGVIDTKLFGNVKTGDVIKYRQTAMPNNFAFGEVLRMGPGRTHGPSSEMPSVQRGSIIGFDLAKVAVGCPSDEGRTQSDGTPMLEEVYFLPFNAALCRFDIDAKLPTPLSNFVLTQQDDAAMDRFQFASRRGEKPSGLILPDTVRGRGLTSNDSKGTNIFLSVERIIDVGPGKWIKSVFQGVPDVRGKLALFVRMVSVDLHAYSVRHRFTPWSSILGVVDL